MKKQKGFTMSFEYKLPDGKTYTTQNNSVIIVGANGSGKSRLGAWIEEQNMKNVHRISGQRILNFNEYIPLKSETQASKELWYGETDRETKFSRWGYNNHTGRCNYTTTVLHDADQVFSLLFAKKAVQDSEFREQCKQAEKNNIEHPRVQTDIVDNLLYVWNNVFPHRKLILKDSQIHAQVPNSEEKYIGIEMSDGEKATLYLIAQCLVVPDGKTIVVDEPELHLHRSIMNKLWDEIEKIRSECLFIYITHDANFVANHRNSDKIWLKGFDGKNWKFEFIKDSELPQNLLIDLLGNRQKVIFVEGAPESYDTEIYSQFYDKYYIVPCGSCSKVIERTKAMRAERQLHDKECFGIIDRDFRPDTEIDALEQDKIFALQVAEVENLFCVKEILEIVNSQIGHTNDEKITDIKNHIQQKFNEEKDGQINQATLSEIKHRIIGCKNKTDLINTINDYDTIQAEIKNKFDTATNVDVILKVFNRKKLADEIGTKFGFQTKEYKELVLRLFKGEKNREIKEALKPYLPDNTKIPY